MQPGINARASAPIKTRPTRLRINPAIHLCSGDLVGAFVEHAIGFDETPSFSARQTLAGGTQTASDWVAEKIIELATYCDVTGNTERPLILPVPAVALLDPNTIDAAANAAAQTRFCHQEISFELTDAALSNAPTSADNFIMASRKRGFRVSVDARNSHSSSLSPNAWLMIDTLRLKMADLDRHPWLDKKVEIAASAGVAIVAQSPCWRDGEYLARLGIDYGLSPRADA